MHHLSLKESAYNIIKEKLLGGEFEPGGRIREDLLAEEISMSRTPVREAISQLAAEGYVVNIPRKGIFFVELTREEILEFIDVRESLEILAVEKCVEKISDEQIAGLEKIVDDFEYALSRERYNDCNALDSAFHQEIARISNNRKLIEFLKVIEDFMNIARFIEKKVSPKEKNMITLKEHRNILQCIKERDKISAKKAVKENIERMKKNMGI